MANEFIGSTVLITVKSPANNQLRGVVQAIEDRVLYLRDGKQLTRSHALLTVNSCLGTITSIHAQL